MSLSEKFSDEDLNALGNDAFRMRFRAWLEQHCPENVRRPIDRLRKQEAWDWLRLLQQHGWRAPGWPRAAGGMGLSIEKQIIHAEELELAQVARVVDLGETHIGPTLLKFGTEEQKRLYLAPILSCENWWCQGYSEPNAGSDLASLNIRAVREGDELVITGQKIWTSLANDSSHVFLLVRTSTERIKQLGITFVLVDLKTPGITIRPIVTLSGEDDFCEVFYDHVRVPVANVVGAIGDGWAVSKALLGLERLFIGSPKNSRLAMQTLRRVGEVLEISDQAEFHETYTDLMLELHALNCLYLEAGRAVATGSPADSQLSILKIVASEHFQRTTEAIMELAGAHGAHGELDYKGQKLDLRQLYMVARPATIYGGTNEIQRNILSKRMLGLPNA